MKKLTRLFIIISILTYISCSKDDENSAPEVAVKIGALAPDFTMADAGGIFYSLNDFKGEYVVVDFWAAWCGICRNENPKMQTLYEKYADEDIQFIGACIDANTEGWKQAVEDDGLTYLQLHDEAAFESDTAKTYGINSVPFMMLLDKSGKILTVSSRVSDIESRLAQEF